MKVLAINGSARKDGNTAILINRVFEELNKEGIETEIIQLAGQVIEPCKACWACSAQENCVHCKDPFRDIFEKMKGADGILLGSPVYSANISANMQALLERAAVVSDRHPGLLTHKVGAAVAAARRGGAMNAIDAMNHFFLKRYILAIILVSCPVPGHRGYIRLFLSVLPTGVERLHRPWLPGYLRMIYLEK